MFNKIYFGILRLKLNMRKKRIEKKSAWLVKKYQKYDNDSLRFLNMSMLHNDITAIDDLNLEGGDKSK